MTSEDEYVSCDEEYEHSRVPPVKRHHKKPKIENESVALAKMLNAISVKDYVVYERRIKQLETENSKLKEMLAAVQTEKFETREELTKRNRDHFRERENKLIKLKNNEQRYKKHVEELCCRLTELKQKLNNMKEQSAQQLKDCEMYRAQIDSMRAEKIKVERNLWQAESDLEEEQFKRDKAELYAEQLRRELLKLRMKH